MGHTERERRLPEFDYHLDEHDPDVVVLRRQDGSFVAAFSARGATRESIVEAAKEDHRRLVEAHASGSAVPEEAGERQRSA
jgi:hypothetical protein